MRRTTHAIRYRTYLYVPHETSELPFYPLAARAGAVPCCTGQEDDSSCAAPGRTIRDGAWAAGWLS